MLDRRVWKPHPQWVFSLVLVALFGWVIYEGWGWPDKTRLFPMFIGIPMFGLAVFQLLRDLSRRIPAPSDTAAAAIAHGEPPAGGQDVSTAAAVDPSQEIANEAGMAHASLGQITMVAAQMLAYFVGMYLLGFVEVIPVYTALYLRFAAKEPWWRSLLLAAVIWAFTWGLFVQVLHLPFTSGVVVDLIRGLF